MYICLCVRACVCMRTCVCVCKCWCACMSTCVFVCARQRERERGGGEDRNEKRAEM